MYPRRENYLERSNRHLSLDAPGLGSPEWGLDAPPHASHLLFASRTARPEMSTIRDIVSTNYSQRQHRDRGRPSLLTRQKILSAIKTLSTSYDRAALIFASSETSGRACIFPAGLWAPTERQLAQRHLTRTDRRRQTLMLSIWIREAL